jgi:hypothetical protein
MGEAWVVRFAVPEAMDAMVIDTCSCGPVLAGFNVE